MICLIQVKMDLATTYKKYIFHLHESYNIEELIRSNPDFFIIGVV